MNNITKIRKEYFKSWVNMGKDLWPESSIEELETEFSASMANNREECLVYLIKEKPVGFINLSMRHDYVNGTHSSPVGYIEGIYVKEAYRKKGIAKRLVEAGEEWSRAHGCQEMASDVLLENKASATFHKNIGFSEAERVVYFVKKIEK